MTLLQSPSEIIENPVLKGMIYGQPGSWKTTLALSAPNPVMIDADKGMYRVEKRFQVPSLPLVSYAALLKLFDSGELAPFETIVFDTLGKLVDRMGEYVIEQNPKNKQGDGSLSMKGWGAVKLEFQNLLKKAEAQNKHLIFVAHEKEEKDGDIRIVRPDVSGSSGKDIVKEMDFMGYIEMIGDKHTISFTPCEKFYAKNSLKLPPRIEIPNLNNGGSNDFIQRHIIEATRERLKEEQAMGEKYNLLIQNVSARANAVTTPEQANAVLDEINNATVIWDSQRVLKRVLLERTKAIGVGYDKETKKFIVNPAPQQPTAPQGQQVSETAVQQGATTAAPPAAQPAATPPASPAPQPQAAPAPAVAAAQPAPEAHPAPTGTAPHPEA